MDDVALSQLLGQLRSVSFATLGHFLEQGFVSHEIRAMVPNVRLVGRAVTLRVAHADAIAVNRALASLTHGDVLVIDMAGDHAHACIGTVTQCAALSVGAMGIVVDGVVTDLVELRAAGLPVFARGTTQLTTKLLGSASSAFNIPVCCGGVVVNPGDVVMADDNGVLILSPQMVAKAIAQAQASDRGEPALLARLRAGEAVESVLMTEPVEA
ncbi:4-hydroxy-4-methyl-2-oxoglutarate aldolase [Pseudomonas putida]|uniref:Putative 4-hydroxy-4-methyl-2-oxoglutarate aldolase n=1 Tax=Pseudomonas putida TaxID=303 RepID=A0AA37REZ4_PSEPU|nr:RraA family protein [Pseudomonas putida]GLO15805.1 4-hydroxy-4-methyl-2-oxoglutarate aldolase [Pseudomonas putida]GLO37477.1 4-hydroxy-4-methyl-2-oxoglutarate aldolase [Pseudomonas putida]HDS0966724.1 RraA family protein [Pseudomonas putida]HDS0993117.1 RraA family protein [Pseudomonas putida]